MLPLDVLHTAKQFFLIYCRFVAIQPLDKECLQVNATPLRKENFIDDQIRNYEVIFVSAGWDDRIFPSGQDGGA
jgi:hypothetical protein